MSRSPQSTWLWPQWPLYVLQTTCSRSYKVSPAWPGCKGSKDTFAGPPAPMEKLREWNELDAAERHLVDGMDLVRGTLTVFADEVTLGYIALARQRDFVPQML